jgi:hypothetical protein
MCASNRMLKEGISWHFEGKPVPESRYSQTVQKEVLNCIFEEVTFEQSHDSDAVFCLKGKISETHKAEYAIRQKTTHVWTARKDSDTASCEAELVNTGPAQISNGDITKNQKPRIYDAVLQVDFFFSGPVKLCNGENEFAVEGEPYTFVTYKNLQIQLTQGFTPCRQKSNLKITQRQIAY